MVLNQSFYLFIFAEEIDSQGNKSFFISFRTVSSLKRVQRYKIFLMCQ